MWRKNFVSNEARVPDYKMRDRLNATCGVLPYSVLFITGWYDININQKLVGHYKAFFLFNRHFSLGNYNTTIAAYLSLSKIFQPFRLIWSAIIFLLLALVGDYYSGLAVQLLNCSLLYSHSSLLQQFLLEIVQKDWEATILKYADLINKGTCFNKGPNLITFNSITVNGFKNIYNQYHNESFYQYSYPPVREATNPISTPSKRNKEVATIRQVRLYYWALNKTRKAADPCLRSNAKFLSFFHLGEVSSWEQSLKNKPKLFDTKQTPKVIESLIGDIEIVADYFSSIDFKEEAAVLYTKILELKRRNS